MSPSHILMVVVVVVCRQVKWLSFAGAVLIELSARQQSASRAATIARELSPLLLDGLDHPFKACREEIVR